jgi:translation initiation factor 2B subunit (eIF-2B alpha/beta/delta family)
VDCVLTGAEIVLENGSIINRAGSLILASESAKNQKPLIVFAEGHKFLRRTYFSQSDVPNHYKID